MPHKIPAIELLVPNPSNAFVVALIRACDPAERWPLKLAYIGAAYGVDETGRIDRSKTRANERFPEWALQLFINDLLENKRTTDRDINDVWGSTWGVWVDWRYVYGMISALENGHNLLMTRKD